jgi:glycosyltransferase involved in cell wall biosynthesis
MGGEGILALQIYQELERQGVAVHQITHARVRGELGDRFPDMNVSYIEDDWLQVACWRSVVLRSFVGLIFQRRASRLARELSQDHPNAVVHVTTPVSPVVPVFLPGRAPLVVGPINGNIFYPPGFRGREPRSWGVRRRLHPLGQTINRFLFPGRRKADRLLTSGGERTRHSLRLAGCREGRFFETLCSGVPDRLLDSPLMRHEGRNLRFVHNGRLEDHKGVDLAIKAVARTELPVELDIIGRGSAEPRLRALIDELGLGDRVRLLPWFKDRADLEKALGQYRGHLFPSLAEAHGIVVQEAMIMGLPTICLDWGGPALLVTPECGVLVPATDEDAVTLGLARALDRLADDGELADRMARAGRARAIAEGYLWSDLIRSWIEIYRSLASGSTPASRPSSTPVATP